MLFTPSFVALATCVTMAAAVAIPGEAPAQLERRIADPGNPANLVNCEPGGGADACNLEQPCNRIRINYGQTEGGHYIWYNYDINNIPAGAIVGVETSCTDYKRDAPLERRIADPGNPASLVNCEPGGGADACNLEQPCSRIRINYGQTEGGHYIWYNYDINNIPAGAIVGVEASCTDYKRADNEGRTISADATGTDLARRVADPAPPAENAQLERRIADPGNPANLVNCEPGGGADACNLEKPCNRIRINYGQTEGGHYIWYNYDINNIPAGAIVGVEASCTDY